MSADTRALFTYIGALGIIALAILLLTTEQPTISTTNLPNTIQVAGVPSTYEPASADVPNLETNNAHAPAAPPVIPLAPPESAEELVSPNPDTSVSSVVRIQNPYPTPPRSFLSINEDTRLALVNILCIPESSGLHATSGSGIIIDPRGVILTNAHVAQYVLLAQSGRTNLSCVVRAGAPAQIIGSARVLYIPSAWIQANAVDITNESPTGMGEHDYALLQIVETPGAHVSLPALTAGRFPALPIDTREGVGFPGDSVLAASYPAEFVGPHATAFNLHPASSITSIRKLLTFDADTVDLLSLAGAQEAQSGSSGGGVVNAWGFLIGIITTTSEGNTTADREMRALTLGYIDRDMHVQAGMGIVEFLMQDIATLAASFKEKNEGALTDLLIHEIEKRYYR